jgi:heme a synthase
VLAWRAAREPREPASDGAAWAGNGRALAPGVAGGGGDRSVVLAVRALTALGALTIFAGTAATAAGPHAGGSPGQRINRLSFDGRTTMDFVIHRHAEIALAFSLCALAVWSLARRRGAGGQVRRPLTMLCALLALQGVVGVVQYETQLPAELVWAHVALACGAWLAALWAACAAGRLAPREAHASSERVREGTLRGRDVPVGGPSTGA